MHNLSRWVNDWMLRNAHLQSVPVREAYQFSLRLEEAAGELYRSFSDAFDRYPRVAEHWRQMAREEGQHHEALCVAYVLNDTRQALEQRFDWEALQQVVAMIEAAQERVRHGALPPQEALEVAERVEGSEMDALMHFLTQVPNRPEYLMWMRAMKSNHNAHHAHLAEIARLLKPEDAGDR